MSVETAQVETFLPINAVLKWGEWFQTICFDHEKNIFIPTEIYKKYEMTN